MECPRCKSQSYTYVNMEETKCLACGHNNYEIPSVVLKEVEEGLGKVGTATKYIRK